MKHTLFLAISSFGLVATTLAGCQDQAGSGGGRRDYIRAVGSSTVYPFATAAAERFIQDNAGMKSPIIESTGTGAGMKLFCAGVGIQHPDIENASRRMKKSEFDQCAANGVKEIVELQIGVDGLALAASKEGPAFALTPKHIYEAMVTGPQNMPVFSDSNVSPEGKRDIITFLKQIEANGSPGGADLGALGPVSEGLFVWIAGLGVIIAFTIWLTSRTS